MTLELSMSALERAIECIVSLLLPQSPTSGVWASHGHVVHAYLQRVPSMGREAALAAAPLEHREALDAIDVDAIATLNADGFAYEVAIALDIDRMVARELGRGIPREEAYRLKRPGELVGTLDVLGTTPDAVIVIDYKSGWKDLGPIQENWQLRGYALLACTLYEKRKAIVGIIRPGSLTPHFESAVLGDIQLDIVEDALRTLRDDYARLRESGFDPNTVKTKRGRWCDYCPAYEVCPRKRAVGTLALGGPLPEVLNEDIARAERERIEELREMLEKADDGLNEYVRKAGRPLDMKDGTVYGPRVVQRRTIHVEKALPILIQELGEEVRTAIKGSLSQSALARLVKRNVRLRPKEERPPTEGGEVQRVMERLRKAGALREQPVETWTRHKAGEASISADNVD